MGKPPDSRTAQTEWVKDCACSSFRRSPVATVNGLRVSGGVNAAGDYIGAITFTPGPVCGACGKPWKQLQEQSDA